MPKILDPLTPQIQATAPTGSPAGPAVGASTGRGQRLLGRGLNILGDAIFKKVEQNEISDISAKLAQSQSDITKNWQEAMRDPDNIGNENFAEDFVENTFNNIDDLRGDLSTPNAQRHFDNTVVKMRAHLEGTVAAGQAELAGIKATQDISQTLDGLSSSLVNDPSSLDLALGMHGDYVNMMAQSGRLPAKAVAKFREEGKDLLTKSSIQGWINLEPQFALDGLNEGKWDKLISGDTKVQLISQSKTAIRALDVEANREKKRLKDEKKEQDNEIINGFLVKMDTNELSTKDILNSTLPPVGLGSKKQMLDMLEKSIKTGLKSDPSTVNELFERIHAPDGVLGKITDESELNEFFGNGLGKKDLDFLRKEISGMKTTEGRNEATLKKTFLDSMKSRITKSNFNIAKEDPIGDELHLQFQIAFQKEFADGKKAGKSITNMLNPKHADYLGPIADQYIRTEAQKMKDQIRLLTGEQNPKAEPTGAPDGIVQIKPGESADAYFKRIGAE